MDTQIDRAIMEAEPRDILEIQPDTVRRKLKAIHNFQAIVLELLHKGHDYGVIPGTDKPTLLKPGAEKIAKLMNLRDDYEVLEKVENWEKGFFHYVVKCQLADISTGLHVSSGLGSCNSMESKYRWRWVFENQLTKEQEAVKETLDFKEYRTKEGGKFRKYRIPNDDIFSQANTLLKMAKKRALVDAALSAGRLSDLFTQDLEELREDIEVQPETEEKAMPEQKLADQAEPKKPVGEKARAVGDMLLEMAGGDKEAASALLQQYSKFTDKEGKEHYARSVRDLTEAWADKILPKVQKGYMAYQQLKNE